MLPDPPTRKQTHRQAVLAALLVTFLWSTSWVLIKIGLRSNLPALTFAGLRYGLAFACLTPLVLASPSQRQALKRLTRRDWAGLLVLGLVFYALTQGAQFASLGLLPAASVSLLLNLTPVVVALGSFSQVGEAVLPFQWVGIGLSVVGMLVYFLPLDWQAHAVGGLLAGLVGLLANALSSLLGRQVNKVRRFSPLLVTWISMGAGAGILLAAGLSLQGTGNVGWQEWLLILWLALVNTALAFTLWNRSLQHLTAVESSVLNGLMLPQIVLLAWLFLGEGISVKELIGLALVGSGTLLVQISK